MTQKKERSLSEISIIPEPVKIIPEEGEFILTNKTVILTDAQSKKNAEFLKQILTQAMGFNLPIIEITPRNKDSNVIILKVNDNNKKINPEGYSLHVSPTEINISAFTPAGVFYGFQTLRQLFPVEIENTSKIDREWFVPCVNIEDSPRFSWRGFMLDESRHFFGKEMVKKLLDQMASLKLNKFHWHLTDDQGWRIEIEKYPLLTEIGSKRKGTITPQNRLDRTPVSGFYSQNELKEIIDYAAERFITIIPEIDVPGHTTAVIASYPELSCTGGPFEVSTHWGIHKEVLCIGKEKTFEVVQDIFNEIIEIFPSDIIHTGGDETPTRRWKRCPDCQTRLKKEGLEKVGDLQVYFTNRIADYLSSQGRRLMGWNEILNEKLSKNAVCQYWTYNFDKVIDHVKNGRDVIMSEMTCVYLNYPYNIIPLSKTYQYDPIPDDLEEKYHQYILGLEACLWAELVPNNKRLERQVFPRLIAVAETGWTPKKKKDFNSFKKRLDSYLKRLELCGINYGH